MGKEGFVYYRKYRNNDKGTSRYGKWYARAVHQHTVEIDELAKSIEKNTSFKCADVVGVINELANELRHLLQNGKRVHIKDIGTFKITMSTTGAPSRDEFDIERNLRSLHVNFLPESHLAIGGTRPKPWTYKVVLRELPEY